jgi:hypothetical protein
MYALGITYLLSNLLKLYSMIVQHMIEEIEGILILLTKKADTGVLTALEALPAEEIKAYRDSLAQEWEVMNKRKKLLLTD